MLGVRHAAVDGGTYLAGYFAITVMSSLSLLCR